MRKFKTWWAGLEEDTRVIIKDSALGVLLTVVTLGVMWVFAILAFSITPPRLP